VPFFCDQLADQSADADSSGLAQRLALMHGFPLSEISTDNSPTIANRLPEVNALWPRQAIFATGGKHMAASRQPLAFLAMVVAGKFNSTDPLRKPSVINPPSLAFATVNLTPLQKPGKVAKVLPAPQPILTMR
jgi:hypothetical protein